MNHIMSAQESTKRKQISPENLHISSFIIVRKNDDDSRILFLKASQNHPLPFRRRKLLLPAGMLAYGEHPKDAAQRILRDQLENSGNVGEPRFLEMQSYLGAHWDICFVFECKDTGGRVKGSKSPNFEGASYHDRNSLPRSEIAPDHLEVLDSLKNLD